MQIHYCIATKQQHLTHYFNAKPVHEYKPIYNATVNSFLPTILDKSPNDIVELKWNFPWPNQSSSQLSYCIPLDNILSHWKQPRNIKLMLLKSIRNNRCVILANCYVVWCQNNPFCVYVQDQRLFTFGGIWNETPSHTGFALLTQPANELLLRLHQQEMPFILHEWQVQYWLNPKTSVAKLSSMMKNTYASAKMNAYPIGPLVNDLNNNTSTIFHPIGEKINPEIDYGVKEKLVRQGWGRNKLS